MSIYFVKGKGWRVDFSHEGQRQTAAWFKTKKEAKEVETKKKEILRLPKEMTPTDTVFLDLANLRLDHVKAYNSERHYQDHVYKARKWVARWGKYLCSKVTQQMVERYILERGKVSAASANKEIRYLRALFNFGQKRKLVIKNPLDGIGFLPIEKRVKYVPSSEDIDKVIAVADIDTQDYLWTLRETMGRMSEINRLSWDDVDLKTRCVILYTRKKKGGNLTPRKVPMTSKLYEVLSRRYYSRDITKPWVFWHRYCSSKDGTWHEGPYIDRKKFMKTLCKKAGVRYFRFHALRHAGASVMDNYGVSIGAIQRILGHENRSTTEIYLHSLGDTERLAMISFEEARLKSHTKSHTNEKGLNP